MPEEKVFSQAGGGHGSQKESESEEESVKEERSSQDETSKIDMKLSRKKTLMEFRSKVEDAILNDYIYGPKENGRFKRNLRNIRLWGVPLLPSKGHEGTDIVLMKFLEAKDYKVPEAFRMLRKTMRWRKEFKLDKILDEKCSPELESMWCTSGVDREGRPLCYYTFRDFKNKEFMKKFLSADERLEEFLRWTIRCVEKGIRMLNFSPGGANSVVQIVDLRNVHRIATKKIRWFYKKMWALLHENYPGILYRSYIVNVPLWLFAVQALNFGQVTPRSKNKFIVLRSPKVVKHLLKSIAPENLLIQHGGLRRENDLEFSTDDKVLELNVRANSVEQIQIPAIEADRTITWDVTVVGTEVTYEEEFIPTDDCSYKVLLQKEKNMGKNVRNSFYIREPGNIVITIGNGTFKRKKVFYRYKSKPCVPMYMVTK